MKQNLAIKQRLLKQEVQLVVAQELCVEEATFHQIQILFKNYKTLERFLLT